MITDEHAEKAVRYLAESATEGASCRADRLHMEAFTKALLAKLARESNATSAAAKEMEALAREEYSLHLESLKYAIEKDEIHRFKREAAQATLDAWRTFQSNQRALRSAP